MAGDFNQAKMKTVSISMWFLQPGERAHLTWPTVTSKRHSGLYFGSSDHLSVMLISAYKPLLIRKKSTVKQVRVLPAGATESLQKCFERTDWDMFKAAAMDNHHTWVEENR